MSFKIVFDNGDGLTLDFNDGEYVHFYNDPKQLAEDVHALRNGGHPIRDGWDGNEEDFNYAEFRQQAEAWNGFVVVADTEIDTFAFNEHYFIHVVEFGEELIM